MGCIKSKPSFQGQNPNQNSITKKPQSVDNRLYSIGAKYLIRQNKTEQKAGNIPGGKMPIKLIFSLDKNFINSKIATTNLSFEISFSDINNPKSFSNPTLINEINQMDLTFSNQIITEYYFEFDQTIKIATFVNRNFQNDTFVSFAKINGSLNHSESVPIIISDNSQPDFKLNIVADPINEELSRVAVSFDMKCNFNENCEFFAVFENTFNNKKQSIYKTAEVNGPNPNLYAEDIAFGDLSFDKSNDQDFDIVFYKKSYRIIEKIGTLVYTLKEVDNMTHNIINENGVLIGNVLMTPRKRTVKRFIDYIYSGLQISMSAAIDFTASNRDPRDTNSLHYINSLEPNQYEQALSSSGNIIAYYDSDKKFPCYGFGGFCNGETSHCFNLTLNEQYEVDGIQGIIQAYKNALNVVQLSGPTYFSPVINKTIQDINSRGSDNGNNYYILLIITDGQITDEDATRRAIVDASTLPLSIIIVGVGNADFSSMNRLDGDDNPLKDRNGKKVRDIVQFVQYNMKYALNPSMFSRDLLQEIPQQVEQYFRSIGK